MRDFHCPKESAWIQKIEGDIHTKKITNKCLSQGLNPWLLGASSNLETLFHRIVLTNNFFNNNEIVSYNNLNDLSNKIKKYSNNDKLRQKIAKNGRNKYFKYFNSTIIAEFIINKTFNINKKYYWENKK